MNELIPNKLEYFKLKKVVLDKETRYLTVSADYGYNKTEAKAEEEPYILVETELSPKVPIHQDLEKIFTRLSIHLAFVSDQLDQDEYNPTIFKRKANSKEDDKKVFDSIICTHVIFNKDEEKGILTLVGQRVLASGNILNMTIPNVRMKHTENYNYTFYKELAECIDEFHKEVSLYLYGKTAPVYIQKELAFTEAEEVGKKKGQQTDIVD